MPEPDWRALLDEAVPVAATPSDALSRLESSVRRAHRRRRWVAAGTPVLVLLLVVGVVLSAGLRKPTSRTSAVRATQPSPAISQPPPPTSAAAIDACRAVTPPADKAVVPADFVAKAGVLCSFDVQRFPGDGTWQVVVVRELAGPLAPLVHALREVHPTQPPSLVCTTQLDGDPPLVLFDTAGHALMPKIPRDNCGHVAQAVTTALSGLSTRELSVLKQKRVRTEAQDVDDTAARTAGCPTTVKEPFNFALTKRRSAGGPFPWWPERPRVCVYNDDEIDTRYADFAGGVVLSTGQAAALEAAIDRPGNRLGCASHAGRTAVIAGQDGSYAQVELGACWRVVRVDRGTRAISAAGRAAVLAVLGDLAR